MPGEKLLQSFGVHTIPIFFGHPEVCKEYSTKAFVNFYDYGSVEKTLERVIGIDHDDDDLYMQMMYEPAFIVPKTYEQHMNDPESFFVKIFETPIKDSTRDITIRSYELVEIYGRRKYCRKGRNKRIISKFISCVYKSFKNIGFMNQLKRMFKNCFGEVNRWIG
jgi:hypothetical protein